MAQWPVTPRHSTDSSSAEASEDRILVDEATSGAILTRKVHQGRGIAFTLGYNILTAAEVATFESFFNTNETVDFDLEWDGVLYVCKFVFEGWFSTHLTGPHKRGRMRCRQVKPT